MRTIILALAASWLLVLSSAGHAFDIIQITDNSTGDALPDISGSNVVWIGCDGDDCYGGDGDSEIYFWDGATITQITNNSLNDVHPSISGSNVVWQHCDAGTPPYCDPLAYEIYLWDGVTTTNITNNSTNDYEPDISGSNVVWDSYVGKPTEIYLWDGVTTTQITNNGTGDYDPDISGSNVVWWGCSGLGSTCEIYLWDGVSITQITNNSTSDVLPAISGSNVVWESSYGIEFWDGSYPIVPTVIADGGAPDISGSNVVWHGYDGTDTEIYLWDGATSTQITDNDTDDRWPAISGSNVVWQGCDGGTGSDCTGGDWEIYMTTISGPTPVPSISFGGLALLAGLVLGSVAWARRR